MDGKGALAVAPDGSPAVALTLPRAPAGKTYEASVMARAPPRPPASSHARLKVLKIDRPGEARLRRSRSPRARRRCDQPTGLATRGHGGGLVTALLTAQPPRRALPRPAQPLRRSAALARGLSDDAALAELYDRFCRLSYGLALRILRDEALAQDAVQEAFLAVWRTADRFLAERAKASTWILTLVHRRAVDLVRREERRRGDPLEVRRSRPRRRPPRTRPPRLQRRLVQEAL